MVRVVENYESVKQLFTPVANVSTVQIYNVFANNFEDPITKCKHFVGISDNYLQHFFSHLRNLVAQRLGWRHILLISLVHVLFMHQVCGINQHFIA